MRLGMTLDYRTGFREVVDELVEYERAGLQIAFVPEAYGFDAVSQLGFLAARTSHLELASGVLPIYTRSPALLAMTAAGLDYVSKGRFTLGLGTSGPQVIEGLHGVPFNAPVGRTRETIEVCRMAWRREPIAFDGRHLRIPLPTTTAPRKNLKLINVPLRENIPIVVGAVGTRNVAMVAEVADGWKPMFYLPERADEVWGDALRSGAALRDCTLGPLDVVAQATLAISDDAAVLDAARERVRTLVALYAGGMGAPERNFYNRLLQLYGYPDAAAEIQRLFLAGQHAAARAAVPETLIDDISLIGTADHVYDRICAYAAAGVSTLNVAPVAPSRRARIELIEQARSLTDRAPSPGIPGVASRLCERKS